MAWHEPKQHALTWQRACIHRHRRTQRKREKEKISMIEAGMKEMKIKRSIDFSVFIQVKVVNVGHLQCVWPVIPIRNSVETHCKLPRLHS